MLSRVARGLRPVPRRAYATRRPIVGGNWKCNPATAASLPELVQNYAAVSQYAGIAVAKNTFAMGGA